MDSHHHCIIFQYFFHLSVAEEGTVQSVSRIHSEAGLWVDVDSEKSIFSSIVRLSNEISAKPCQYGKTSEWSRSFTQSCDGSEIKPLL